MYRSDLRLRYDKAFSTSASDPSWGKDTSHAGLRAHLQQGDFIFTNYICNNLIFK